MEICQKICTSNYIDDIKTEKEETISLSFNLKKENDTENETNSKNISSQKIK